jgi:uncharacterized membrane protein
LFLGVVYTALLVWYTVPSSRGVVMALVGLGVIASIGAPLRQARNRSQLRIILRETIARVRGGPPQLLGAFTRLIDSRSGRAIAGLLSIVVAIVGVAGLVTTLNRGRGLVAIVGWAALAGVANVASWALIARRSTSHSVASVALQSASELVFSAEDQEDPQRFDFSQLSKIELTVRPTAGTDHWRLGIEFSDNQQFSGWRYGIGHALWHLAKDRPDARLLISYYNAQGQFEGNSVGMDPYDGGTVHVTIEPRDGALVARVLWHPGYTRVIHADYHRYGRLFAWADGRRYQLVVTVRVT